MTSHDVCVCVTAICGCVGQGLEECLGDRGARAAQTSNVKCCVNAVEKKQKNNSLVSERAASAGSYLQV